MTETSINEETRVTLGPLATDLPFMIRNLHSVLRPIGATVREALGLADGSIGVLSLVWVNPGISQNDLAASLAMKKSAVAAVVKKLESDGLLERKRVEGDRRMNAITLTDDGHRMVARIQDATGQLNAAAMADVSEADREVFFRVLATLQDGLTQGKAIPDTDAL